jgi:hypothetical protein
MSRNQTESEAKKRFLGFFSELTEERVRARIRDTYAESVHFHDTLKEVRGVDRLEKYLVDTARAVESCTVELEDLAVSDDNYYFRWVMHIRFKRFRKGAKTRSIGMSHIKFDGEGKIIFHQDYWDSSAGLFEHIPLAGSMIRLVKSRL